MQRENGCRHFMIDPGWKPWEHIGGDYVFPPFARVMEGAASAFAAPTSSPDVYDLAARSLGVTITVAVQTNGNVCGLGYKKRSLLSSRYCSVDHITNERQRNYDKAI
jgi:hypothetical protein